MQKSRRGHLFQDQTTARPATACPPLQRPSRIRCLNLTRGGVEQKGACYRMATPPATAGCLQCLSLVIVRDLAVADSMPDEGDLLPALLAAVAFGIALVSLRTWQHATDPFTAEQCVRHVPSREVVSVSVIVTETFASKHRKCTKLLEAAASGPRSRWKVRTVGDRDDDPKACRMHTMGDVAAFIRRVRRVSRTSGKMAGTLFPCDAAQQAAPAKMVGPRRPGRPGAASKKRARPGSGTECRKSLRDLFAA